MGLRSVGGTLGVEPLQDRIEIDHWRMIGQLSQSSRKIDQLRAELEISSVEGKSET